MDLRRSRERRPRQPGAQWDASCATAYEIDPSNDHTSWKRIYSTTSGKGGVEDLTTLDGTGRYVRMYGTKRCRSDDSHGYSLQEYRVYNVVDGKRTQVGSSTTTSTTVGGLTSSTPYHLQVTALDGNDNESDGSTPILDVTTSSPSQCTPSQGVCTVKQVGTDDDVVWGLVTLPDGTILYNQRDAHSIVHLNPATGAKKTIGTVPNVQSTDGEGGLTGLEINPVSFSSDHWLYIMHTSPSDNRIVRIKYDTSSNG